MALLHTLRPERATLHGRFSPDLLPPALTVDSGDAVRFETLDVSWGSEQHGEPGTPRRKFGPREAPRDDGPALCGPVAVRGARPGMVLEVRVLDLRTADWGWTWSADSPHTGALRARLGLAGAPPVLLRWELDRDRGVAVCRENGATAPLRPFLGTIGLAPAAPGWHCGWTPRAAGGNLDCRELTAGSRLYLPVEAEGALLSAGDGHAAQGDGEAGGTAIECPMERADLRLVLHESAAAAAALAPGALPLPPPCAHAPGTGWIAFGFGPTLDDAAASALGAALDGLRALRPGLDRAGALALAGVLVDLRVTQAVNGAVGAHAVLRDPLARAPAP